MLVERHFGVLKQMFLISKSRLKIDHPMNIILSEAVDFFLEKVENYGNRDSGRWFMYNVVSWWGDLWDPIKSYESLDIRLHNEVWSQDIRQGTCTCPAFERSPFLFCKHLYAIYRPTDWVKFVHSATRLRPPPFWSSRELKLADGIC
ncbi:hypothetical protein I308_106268 [Cryptococcus tetragattii IND107]|uniref:SWIM-type domain-containing protein n=1 Tax=Cryptococcus tetragattii IND107 TaxID=1296105 RepID=A0ABR3BIE4_9TREE